LRDHNARNKVTLDDQINDMIDRKLTMDD